MISILPEHAPPGSDHEKYKLIVADDVLCEFDSQDAVLILNAFAEDFLHDMSELELSGLLPGGVIDVDSLELAMKYMVVTQDDETIENVKYTEMFRKLIRQKFYWKI